jgi:predicted RNA-binding Zn ribbon-like protein
LPVSVTYNNTMPVATPPPHELQLVLDFVNTLDLEQTRETLATPASLSAWLVERGLSAAPLRLGPAHLRHALELRETLRSVMLEHNGGPAADLGELQRVAEWGRLAVSFDSDCDSVLVARAPGFDGALAQVLIPVAESATDGTWARAKACRAEDCRWAFYDSSRNRSGRWCDMAVCGNRTKVRAYRQRTAG